MMITAANCTYLMQDTGEVDKNEVDKNSFVPYVTLVLLIEGRASSKMWQSMKLGSIDSITRFVHTPFLLHILGKITNF